MKRLKHWFLFPFHQPFYIFRIKFPLAELLSHVAKNMINCYKVVDADNRIIPVGLCLYKFVVKMSYPFQKG